MMKPGTKILAALALAALLPAAALAGQDYPRRPVRLIVPYAAGGGADTLARMLGQRLGELLEQPVVVENKPGGATITGTQFVVKAAPDGHTLLIGTANLATNAALFGQLPYDASRDLAPVSLLVRVPVFAFAHAGANIASLNDLVAQSHGTPGGLSYATAGNGSAPHLAGELFRLESKSRIAHIPYNGSAQAAAALVGGQVPLSFDNLSPLLAHVKTGAVVPLAIAMPERSGIAPEVPTFKELGYPMQAYSWWGVLAPAGTPPAIVERLNQEIRKALQMPQIRDKLHAQGMQAVGSSAAEFAAHIRAETDKWRRVVTDARIQTQ